MHMKSPAAALLQDFQVASRLGVLYDTKSVAMSGYRQIVGVLGRDLKKHTAVRAALVSLAGGVQESRAEAADSRHTARIAHNRTHAVDHSSMFVVALAV